MDAPEIPKMLDDQLRAALRNWADWPDIPSDRRLLVAELAHQGLELRLVDSLLEAQETTGEWKVDG